MSTDHLKLLCDIEEIGHLFTGPGNVDTFLEKAVEMVARHMRASVCSIYIFDESEDELTLQANVGLNREKYKDVRLSSKEGLVGKAIRELRPICLDRASESPEYKFFPELDEKEYDAFLAVPIRQGLKRIGALVVQRKKDDPFNRKDVEALTVISSQMASILLNVKQLVLMKKEKKKERVSDIRDLKFLKGKSASTGFAFASARVKGRKDLYDIIDQSRFDHEFTMDSLTRALETTRSQLEKLQESMEEKLSDVASLIFTAHLLILKDDNFTGEMITLVEGGMRPPEAIVTIGKKYMDMFAATRNRIIREKQQDVEDLVTRILNNLASEESSEEEYKGHIVIAEELFPSDVLKLASEDVNGIIVIYGGTTSHSAILARSLNIPMVIVDKTELMDIPKGTKVIIDGEQGNVYVSPDEEVIAEFNRHRESSEIISKNRDFLKMPTVTRDGVAVKLFSNINLLSDLNQAREGFSDGIGLYRTEFPFLIRTDFPEEEEQYKIYLKLVKGMPGKPVTFRTLDLGGDKLLAYGGIREQNPFLGFRSIRFSLKHREVFVKQVRAILRASVDADLRIMFPMISSLDEFIEAENVLKECVEQLKKEGRRFNSSPKVGIMVEVPSIIDILDDIAVKVDFFSVGTNDLIQFLLAVDRTNDKVSVFYNPAHPSILRVLKKIIETSEKHKVDVSICGDMAHEERYLPIILGAGFRQVSVNPVYIPRIKTAIMNIDAEKARLLTEELLKKTRISEVEELIDKFEFVR